MSTTDPTCSTCGHQALDHTNIRDIGCTVPACPCSTRRRDVQTLADNAATAQAIAQVDENADALWTLQATGAIQERARTGDPFTTDDIWEDLAAAGVPEPREPRALGPIVKRLTSAGDIHGIGFTASRRRHQAIIRVYSQRDL